MPIFVPGKVAGAFGVLASMSPWLSDLFLSSQSDERLIALVRDGHERAFAVIVERYCRELNAFARRLRSDGRGEDLVQQTFLSAFSALRSGTEVMHLRGWLYQILRNTSISTARRPHAEVELDGTITGEPLEDAVERRLLALQALSEVAALPERQRDALVATAIQGRSRAAVATSMGLSEGAVRQLMHRARVSLRTSVTAITPWPFARWLAAARTGGAGNHVPEIVVSAGTASVGGVAVKLGALVATGVVATGVVSSQVKGHHAARPPAGPRSARTAAPSPEGLTTAVAARKTAGGVSVVAAEAVLGRAAVVDRSGSDGPDDGSGTHAGDQGGSGGSDGGNSGSRDGGGSSTSLSGSDGGSGSDGAGGGGQTSVGGGSGSDGGASGGGSGSDRGASTAVAASSTSGGHGDGGSGSGSGDTTSGSDGGSGRQPLSSSGGPGPSSDSTSTGESSSTGTTGPSGSDSGSSGR